MLVLLGQLKSILLKSQTHWVKTSEKFIGVEDAHVVNDFLAYISIFFPQHLAYPIQTILCSLIVIYPSSHCQLIL